MKTVNVYDRLEFLISDDIKTLSLEDAKLYCFSLGYRLPEVDEIESFIYFLAFNQEHDVDLSVVNRMSALCIDEMGYPAIASTEVTEYRYHQEIQWYDLYDAAQVFPVRTIDKLAYAA